jgi:hypothetical protein
MRATSKVIFRFQVARGRVWYLADMGESPINVRFQG